MIGVFDSGVGGVSVLREVRGVLPRADLLYVADSAHCPYGGKPDTEIRARALAIGAFLVQQGADVLVVACNTATSAAIEDLRAAQPNVPVVGMEPAVKPVAAATKSGVVGVLATGSTLDGSRFAELVERFGEGVRLLTQPCPGLVEQVEAGDLDGPRTRELLWQYVEPLLARRADTLVVGCTHYPFLRPTLAELVGPGVTLIDTGAAVARQVARVAPEASENGAVQWWSSDVSVAPVLARLWGAPSVRVEQLPVQGQN